MACAICHVRRPRRFCPGAGGDICTLCCGTEREVTIECPLDCEYLMDAHQHEKHAPLDPETAPHADVTLPNDLLNEHSDLVVFLAKSLFDAALETAGVIDYDIREAIEAAIQTHRTAESGLLYETVPRNPLAARIARALSDAIEKFRAQEARDRGVHQTRDRTVLQALVLLQRLELTHNNGRRRGRAFIEALGHLYTAASVDAPPAGSSLLLP